MEPSNRSADMAALLLVAAIGAPLIYGVASAFADGEVRRREMPVRSLIGTDAYEALAAGRQTPQHYMGNDRTAPDFELPQRDGSTWRLSDHRGKVLVLNFWTVTCQPCMEEMPSLISLSRILADRDDIELITISVDRDWETVRSAVPDDVPMTVLLDPDREVVREKFGTRLFPETWVIDPDGVIRLRVDGRRDWSSAVALDVFETYL
ncbi:MAG: TlpA disulfide reductase family protein [Myxococcota bacterium]|nr:TlpA disulfide reductase family protein [Myxococcota bacterium]